MKETNKKVKDSYKNLCQKIEYTTKELPHDSKPGTKDVPNDKTKEQVVVVPEIKTNRNQENIKQREIESKKMRRMDPRNLIKTKEEMEMMNHGLIDINNIPITNKKEIMNARDYGSRLKVISEMIYQQTVVYQWERTRGKWPVSYTHLDVYKRQVYNTLCFDNELTTSWCCGGRATAVILEIRAGFIQ